MLCHLDIPLGHGQIATNHDNGTVIFIPMGFIFTVRDKGVSENLG